MDTEPPPATVSVARQHTCIKLETDGTEPVFVKGTWFDSHFHLSISDGLHSWVCSASDEEVRERADQWDQPVTDYIQLAEKHLGFQQPGSVYRFSDAGGGHKRLSWTFEKEGTKLEWRWKCQPSSDSRKTTAEIMDFLMDATIRLSEEVVRQTQSISRLKDEAEKCLAQSERFTNEKMEFESAIYAKFVAVLNSKKRKIRELRDQLSKKDSSAKLLKEEEEDSTDKTETYDEDNDDVKGEEESSDENAGTSKATPTSKGRRRKRV